MHPVQRVIGLVSREYPPHTHVGGMGTYTATAARLLADYGHTVHVFCNGPETIRTHEAGIHLHRIRMGGHPLPTAPWLYWYRRWYRKQFPSYLESLTWAKTVADYLRVEAPLLRLDALEYPETNGEGALLDVDSGLEKTRRICRIHTSWIPEYVTGSLESRRLLGLQARACAKADLVVSPSRAMAGDYARRILGWKKPVAIAPNPLQLWREPIDWERKAPDHLLFVGRVEYRKGIDLLLQALEELGAEAQGITLRIAASQYPPGNAADAGCQELFSRARQNHENGASGIGYRLEYVGPVPHAELHRHFDWAGMVVLPSRQDNFPYVALEAQSRGCFVLGSDAGGVPETLEGCRGAVFPSGDQGALTRKMRELTRNGGRISESWRHNAAAIAERFEPGICHARLLETYAGSKETEALPP